MTTLYDFRTGRFAVVDAATATPIQAIPTFATWAEARAAIGNRWVDVDASQDNA